MSLIRIPTRMILAAGAVIASAACSPAQTPAAQDTAATTATASATHQAAPPDAAPPVAPLADPLSVGSQEARDDLYCAGVLIAAHPMPMEALVPVEQARVERGQTNALIIGETGVQKLIKEGVAVSGQASQILDAWADTAGKDVAAGRPRLSLETCTTRAEATSP